jgi:hypothetical protein
MAVVGTQPLAPATLGALWSRSSSPYGGCPFAEESMFCEVPPCPCRAGKDGRPPQGGGSNLLQQDRFGEATSCLDLVFDM